MCVDTLLIFAMMPAACLTLPGTLVLMLLDQCPRRVDCLLWLQTGAGGGGKGEGDDAGEFAVDYRLYQAFWRLQKYALKQDAAVKGAEAKDTWNAILADVDKVGGAWKGACWWRGWYSRCWWRW